MEQKLKKGYTTGSCGAAGAMAATILFLNGQHVRQVELCGPKGDRITVFVALTEQRGQGAVAAVCKDSGDDPDVTNGIMVFASVEPCRHHQIYRDQGYGCEQYPFLTLTGGEGVGLVTKPGLSCPVGHYAINPAPREMIFQAVGQLLTHLSPVPQLLIRVWIPMGRQLAEKTFNPRLGIKGGLSVLGTSGVVEPMSVQALLETIRLEIHMKALEGTGTLAMTPGNYGKDFVSQHLGIELQHCIKCSNFIGDSLSFMASEGIRNVLLVGHLGKLIKVAAGQMNTHSAVGDCRMETLADCGLEAGLCPEQAKQILQANTTEEALSLLIEMGKEKQVMQVVVARMEQHVNKWRGLGVELVVFSSLHGLLHMTKGAKRLIQEMTKGALWQENYTE